MATDINYTIPSIPTCTTITSVGAGASLTLDKIVQPKVLEYAYDVNNAPTANGLIIYNATGGYYEFIPKSTDGTLLTNSDNKIPTEQAVKTYVDSKFPATTLESVDITATPSPDTYEGFTITREAHEDMVIGSLGFINSSGEVELTDVDSATSMPGCVLSTEIIDQSAEATGVFLLPGGVIHLHTLAPEWAIGGIVYAGSGPGSHTPGSMSQSPPEGDFDICQIVGIALAADILLFIPSLVTVEVHA